MRRSLDASESDLGAGPIEARAPARPFVRRGAVSFAQAVWIFVALAFVMRLICAAVLPLATDEVLYWRYSRHLAAGFLDHPVMNPALIRAGTSIFGDSPFGIRFFPTLLSLPASWAVWRAGAALFRNPRIGARAALFFNLTLVMSVGSILATSDASVVATSAFLLLGLAKLIETRDGRWWLAIGAAFGLGMLAKYTTFFFAAGILVWLMAAPTERRWLRTPWPYLGGVIALAIFAPVIAWNADHHWASIVYQSSRMIVRHWTLRYAIELISAQIALATPSIFVLACVGLFAHRKSEPRSSWTLLASFIVLPLAYFIWHSLHERVQANWPESVFPALVCAAAAAVHAPLGRVGRWSTKSAVPVGIALALFAYAQIIFGVPLGAKDPTARVLTAGWPTVAERIDAERQRIGAPVVLTTDYSAASLLAYFLPSRAPVEQISDRVRWANEPQPDARLFDGPMLYVCRNKCGRVGLLPRRFGRVSYLTTIERQTRGRTIDRYSLYLLSNPIGPVLDPLYPIRLKGVDDDYL